MLFTMTIPEELTFSDLNLAKGEDGDVVFSWQAIDAICAASGINPAVFRNLQKSDVDGLIACWYMAHRHHGGDEDQVAEELLKRTQIEEILCPSTLVEEIFCPRTLQ